MRVQVVLFDHTPPSTTADKLPIGQCYVPGPACVFMRIPTHEGRAVTPDAPADATFAVDLSVGDIVFTRPSYPCWAVYPVNMDGPVIQTLVKAPTKFNLAALENACEVPFHKWAPENQEMLRAAVAEGAIPEVLMADGSWKVKPVDLAGASEIIRVIGWEPKRGYWEKNELGIVRESTPSEGELFLGKSQVKSGAFNLRIGAKDRLSRGYWNLLEISIVDGELAIQRVGGIHSEGIGNEPDGTVKMI